MGDGEVGASPQETWRWMTAGGGRATAGPVTSAAKTASYRESEYWRKYQAFFPERYRLDLDAGDARLPEESFWHWRGAEIHLDRYEPPGARLSVILLHGGGGYGRLLAPIGAMLRARGFAVVAPDLPGYGLSRCGPELVDHEAWVDCVAALLQAELEARPGRPVVLFGLSLGGYLAYQVAARTRLAAGVIATTLADPRLPRVRDELAKNRIFSRVGVPFLRVVAGPLGGVRVPIRWMSRMHAIANDARLAQLVCEDPLGGGNRTPLGFLRSLFEMVPDIEPEDFDVCPVLLAHPGDDRWTTLQASRLFFDRIAGPKKLVVLEGCGHMPVEEPGVTELDRAVTSFLESIALGEGDRGA
jgi:alpha-beta hydrolase superfamily lysophospholipase